MTPNDPTPDVELLGQKFWLPNSKFKLIAFIFLVFCLTVISIFITCNYDIKKTKDGFSAFRSFNMENDEIIETNGFVIGFWTPCNETVNYLDLSTEEQQNLHSWETKAGNSKTIDSLNIEFGDLLKKEFNFSGYRRCKVLGKGEKVLKEGWWWSIGFEGTCDEDFLKKFKDIYIEFWRPKNKGTKWDKIYVEVVGKSKS